MYSGFPRIALGVLASVTLCGANATTSHALTTHALPAHAPPTHASGNRPVVVELFTAQGCTGCPGANATVERIARDPKIIVLTYGVDYWDYLGWQDTFARPEFSARQRGYRQTLGQRSVSTPQIIIDGQRPLTPRSAPEVFEAVASVTIPDLPPPDIEFRQTGDRVAVGSGKIPAGGAEVVAIRYAPGRQMVEVRAGENQGISVPHINVVKEIRYLGEWTGRPALYVLPRELTAPALEQEAVVVMVQGKQDRRILSVARLPELRHD